MIRVCKICDSEFELKPDHQGKADVCLNCGGEDVPLLMAKVSYPTKHVTDAIIEITADRKAAINFNRAQRRNCAGPLRSIIAGREPVAGREARKDGSGAESGALYYSRLGEKRRVKP